MKFVKSPALPGFFLFAVVLRRELPPAKFSGARDFTVPTQHCRLSLCTPASLQHDNIDPGYDRYRCW
jgi:hypothetical protein